MNKTPEWRGGPAWRSSLRPSAVGLAAIGAILVGGWGGASPSLAADAALDQAATLRAAGQFDEALEVLRIESRKIKQLEGETSLRLLVVNDLAAEVLVDMGSLDAAATLLDKTIAAREKLIAAGRGEQSALLGGCLLTRARLEAAAKRLPAAVDAARQALLAFDASAEPAPEGVARASETLQAVVGSLEELLGANAEATHQAREDIAATYASLGMFAEAVEQRRKILARLLAGGEASASEIVAACEHLGRAMLDSGQADEAIEVLGPAIAKLGPAQAEAALPLRRLLGELAVAADKLVLAEESFARALDATRSAAKPSALAETAGRIQGLLVAVISGAVDRLPDWYPGSVKSLERASRTDASQAIPGLVAAARVEEEIGDPAAAVALAGKALELASSMAAADARQVADLSARLVALQLAAGTAPAALKTAERALPVAERQLGPGDAGVSSLRILLADILSRQGKIDQAAAMASKALARPLPRPSDAWEEQATAIYDRLAEADGQRDLRERYLAARAAQFGETHPHVASACGLFGAARLAAGDWPAALALLSRAHDIRRVASGDDDPETAASLVLLAHAERMAGDRPQQAAETAARGLAAWEKVAGPDHPGTLSAAEVLLAARYHAGETTGVVDILERLCAADSIEAPARQAAHLVQLADVVAAGNKPRARELLQKAMQLSCWDAEVAPGQREERRLAFTAALAAHAFRVVGDATAATEALQRARQLALRTENPKPLLDRIETLAEHGPRAPLR